MEAINQSVKSSLRFLDNPYVSSTIALVVILYATLAAPRLPPTLSGLFNNAWFRLLILFAIAYVGAKDPSIALIVALAFTISIQTLNHQSLQSQLLSYVNSIPFIGPKLSSQGPLPIQGVPMMADGSAGMAMPMPAPNADGSRGASLGANYMALPEDEGYYLGQPAYGGCMPYVDETKVSGYDLAGVPSGYDEADMESTYKY
jgi:hypothetical protein